MCFGHAVHACVETRLAVTGCAWDSSRGCPRSALGSSPLVSVWQLCDDPADAHASRPPGARRRLRPRARRARVPGAGGQPRGRVHDDRTGDRHRRHGVGVPARRPRRVGAAPREPSRAAHARGRLRAPRAAAPLQPRRARLHRLLPRWRDRLRRRCPRGARVPDRARHGQARACVPRGRVRGGVGVPVRHPPVLRRQRAARVLRRVGAREHAARLRKRRCRLGSADGVRGLRLRDPRRGLRRPDRPQAPACDSARAPDPRAAPDRRRGRRAPSGAGRRAHVRRSAVRRPLRPVLVAGDRADRAAARAARRAPACPPRARPRRRARRPSRAHAGARDPGRAGERSW